MVRLGQEGLTAVRAVRTLIFYIIAYTELYRILQRIESILSPDHRALTPNRPPNTPEGCFIVV